MQVVTAYVTISGFTHKQLTKKFAVEVKSGILKSNTSLDEAVAKFQRDVADDVFHRVTPSYSVRYRLSIIWGYDLYHPLLDEFRGKAEEAIAAFLALKDRYTITEIE